MRTSISAKPPDCWRRGFGRSLSRLLLLAAVIIWGWTFIATKILVAELGPVEILSLRLLIGLPFLAVVVLLRRTPMRFAREDAAPIALGGTIFAFHLIPGGALGQWFWQEGVARIGATRAGLYLYLEPIATLALAVPMLGEPFGVWVAIGGGLVLAGVYAGQRAS